MEPNDTNTSTDMGTDAPATDTPMTDTPATDTPATDTPAEGATEGADTPAEM